MLFTGWITALRSRLSHSASSTRRRRTHPERTGRIFRQPERLEDRTLLVATLNLGPISGYPYDTVYGPTTIYDTPGEGPTGTFFSIHRVDQTDFDQPVSLAYQVYGTAQAGVDYTGPSHNTYYATIPAYQWSTPAAAGGITVMQDNTPEPDRQLFVSLYPGNYNTANTSVTFTIDGGPQAPQLNSIPDYTVDEHNLLSFTASISNPQDGAVFYSLGGSAPGGASINSTSGAFTWTPSEAQGPGTYTFDVVATNQTNSALFDTESLTVTVNEVNQPPIISTPSNATVPANTPSTSSLVKRSFTVTDLDIPVQGLSAWATSSNTSIVGTPSVVFVSGNTWEVTFPPQPDQHGTVTITLMASDGVDTSSTSFTVTVQPPPPVVTIGGGGATVTEGTPPPYGVTYKSFLIDLSTPVPSGQSVTVSYVVETAGTGPHPADSYDFQSMSGSVTIPAGADHSYANVAINKDSTVEWDESFRVRLTSVSSLLKK